jgi:dihydroorotase-like cyclic amidohydrolase
LDGLVERMVYAPRRIFGLAEQAETWVEFDPTESRTLSAAGAFTRCGWTPYEGMRAVGRVRRVVLRGRTAFADGKILAQPGSGRDVRDGV